MSIQDVQIPQNQIQDFCRRWKINEFALFGSALRQDFGPDSDLDVLVTFAPDARWSLFDHIRMEEELENIFHREVDLVTRRAIEQSQNWIRRQEMLTQAQVIFSTSETPHGD